MPFGRDIHVVASDIVSDRGSGLPMGMGDLEVGTPVHRDAAYYQITLALVVTTVVLSGLALANRRPCSNWASESTFPPLSPSLPLLLSLSSFPFPSAPFPFPHFPPPRRKVALLKPTRGSGERCKHPRRVRGRATAADRILLHCMLAKRIWLQHFWFFGQHCNEWHNDLCGIFTV